MRCKFIKADGNQCKNYALPNYETCLYHLTPEEKHKYRSIPMDNYERAMYLTREIRRVSRSIHHDPKERARLLTKLMDQLLQVTPKNPIEDKQAETLEDKLDKWQKEKSQI